jgi:uncharacterized membrane protein YgdD (TMEM256/DUF423 family)
MPRHARIFIACGALSAALAVMLAAAASHVPAVVQAATNASFVSALQMQQFHALGLLAIGLLAIRVPDSRWFAAAGTLLILGSLLFSGNLYLRTLAGVDTFRALVPWGGSAWILGWLALAIGALQRRAASTDFLKN